MRPQNGRKEVKRRPRKIKGCFSTLFGFKSEEKTNVPETSISITGQFVKERYTPITERYDLSSSVLGRGASAEVVIGTHNVTKRQYAVKIIDATKSDILWRCFHQ